MKYSGTPLTVNVFLAVLNEHLYKEMYYSWCANGCNKERGDRINNAVAVRRGSTIDNF